MAVEQQRCSCRKAGRHRKGFFGSEPDEHETLPCGAVSFGHCLKPSQECFLEFEDIKYVHAGDERLSGRGGGIGKDYVFEFVVAWGKDGGALIDLGGIEEVEYAEVLDGEDGIHAFEAEAALAVEEVGDVGLLESGLLCQPESGQAACFDSPQEDFTKVVLQTAKLH